MRYSVKNILLVLWFVCATTLVLECAFAENAASSRILIFNQESANASGGSNDGQQACRNLQLGGTGNTMGSAGCGIYAMAHAYQWLNGGVSTSDAVNLLSSFIQKDSYPWDGTLDEKYKSLLNCKAYPGVMWWKLISATSESNWKSFFDAGGVVVLNIPPWGYKSGHYFCAVGMLTSAETGTGEMWLHIVDSSCGSTFKRLYNAGASAYGFVGHGQIVTSTGNGFWRGDEYYISLSGLDKAGITVQGAYVSNGTPPTPTTAYLDVNGWLDGGFSGDLSDYGTVDVYINGNLVADDVNDYYTAWPVGTSYEIRDIRARTGHIYWGPHISYLSGTIDASGTDVELSFDKDGILPTVSNVKITNLTSEGYTVTCTVSDNNGVTKVQFPTWYAGQQGEDATWHDGTISGNTATCYIKVSDHGGKTGLYYHTDIYAWDTAGNMSTGANARYNYVPNPTVHVTSITLDKSELTMDIGTSYRLAATVLPSNATDKSLFWATNNSAVCTVEDGVVSAVGAGAAVITCAANDGSGVSVTCNVTVNEPIPDFILPAGLIEIDEEAFAGINVQRITIPSGVEKIGKRAFAGCTKLKYIYIPAATTQIAGDAFTGVTSGFEIHGKLNSYAQTYASQNGYTFIADDACTITFNANGGSCSTSSKTVNIGAVIGTLPSASRSYYTFNGWYTAATGGSKVSASSTFTSSTTLYAQWTEHEWSDWVTEDQLPSGTIQKDSKQQYRYQDKVYSAWSDWGPRTETRESTSELKKEQQITEYYWYYDLCQNCGRHSPYTVCWDCGYSIGANWRVTWLDISKSQGGQFGNTDKVFTGTSQYDRWFYWTDDNGNGDSRTVYQYATRTYTWGSWSEWSDAYVSSSSTRNVDSRYVYRYKLP